MSNKFYLKTVSTYLARIVGIKFCSDCASISCKNHSCKGTQFSIFPAIVSLFTGIYDCEFSVTD